jgi:alginate O-acetyltransferase complex protein AlgI
MVFNSLTFLVFVAAFFPVYFALKGNLRLLWSLAMSYLFYGWWDWRFLSLIVLSTVVDWWLGIYIGRQEEPKARKNALIMSMVMNLGFLGFFKYFNFFIDSFIQMQESIGLHPSASTLNIILPVGISFYTFQSMSYTIDVYKKEIPVEPSLLKFATFIALFPQLVAGPIVRAIDLLPQMGDDKKFEWQRLHSGLGRILWGFFKKVAIADSIAPFVDQIFTEPGLYSSSHLLVGVIFYSFQIYCDFSGYSDIAIGLARIMGYDFPENFRTPYFSKNFSEFWARWHISLSSWLRDYLYIPLGGNRQGKWGTYKNNMITMLLGGLWHGANWAFVFWGFLHGLFLIVQRLWAPYWKRINEVLRLPKFVDSAISILTVFALTNIAWVYFRGGSLGRKSFDVANQVLGGILSFDNFTLASIINKFQFVKGAGLILILVLIEAFNPRMKWNQLQLENPAFRLVAFSVLVWLIALFGSFGASAFIYFQF